MNFNDIENFKYKGIAKGIVEDLNNNINGRVALNNMLQSTHVLYIIKNLLGDKCKTVLEIGTLWGGALLTMMQTEHKSKFVSIDMFEGFYPELLGEGNSDQNFGVNTLELVTENIEKNNEWKHEYDLIKGSSHDSKVINYVKENYPEIDLLFIDGDHTKKGVLQDWDDYSNLVTKGGIVVFDDYWVGKYERAAWRKEDDEGVKWMDVVGAVDEIINNKTFLRNWKDVGLLGDKKIIERL
jgi:cephalosporin hydroxylase